MKYGEKTAAFVQYILCPEDTSEGLGQKQRRRGDVNEKLSVAGTAKLLFWLFIAVAGPVMTFLVI